MCSDVTFSIHTLDDLSFKWILNNLLYAIEETVKKTIRIQFVQLILFQEFSIFFALETMKMYSFTIHPHIGFIWKSCISAHTFMITGNLWQYFT